MKIKHLWLLLIAIILTNHAKSQNPVWALPNNNSTSGYLINGNNYFTFPTIDPITGIAYTDVEGTAGGYIPAEVPHRGAANAVSNEDGDLLFFIVGNSIFDGDGRTIWSNFEGDYGNISNGYSEIAVIPNPANCTQYYIVTEMEIAGYSPGGIGGFPVLIPVYTILDLTATDNHASLNSFISNENKQAALIEPFTPLHSLTPFTNYFDWPKAEDVQIAATPLNASNERFLFVIAFGGLTGSDQYLFKFRLNSSGISFVGNQLIDDLTPGSTAVFAQGRNEFEVIEVGSNYRLAFTTNETLVIFDLDGTSLNLIPGSLKTPSVTYLGNTHYVRGLEFTTSGNYLYFTREPSGGSLNKPLNCYNLLTNSFVNIPSATILNSGTNTEYKYSFIEMGNDGNLYLAKNDYLCQISGIENPSTALVNASFQPISYAANNWDFNYTSNQVKRYTLPDQIDGEDYAAHFDNNPACCLTNTSYNAVSYTANSTYTGGFNQIWTPILNPFGTMGGNEVYVTGDLVIPSGMNITITNMIFYFHPDSRVIVERSNSSTVPDGARLNLNNTTFTVDNRCGNGFMWQGVDIEGWSSQPQTPINNSKQGYLNVYNHSRIEHAKVGANTYFADSVNSGGIVRTNNATFYNNRIDVRITNYTHPPSGGIPVENQSSFVNTSFITEGIHNDPSLPPLSHAFLLNAGGIKFSGCHFKNLTPDLYSETNRGKGIHNISTKLTVIPSCSLPLVGCVPNNPCVFENLAYGIYSHSGSTLISTFVDGNDFINNFYGVYIGGLTGSTVQRNEFEVLNSQNPSITANQTAGVYLNACTRYKVTENTFTQTDGNSTLTNSRGIVVHNSGEAHNEIYKNIYHNILVGGQSQSVNGVNIDLSNPNNAEPIGLQWLCNDFQNNIDVDLYVSSGRIDYQQGYYLVPSHPSAHFAGARNQFFHESGDYEIVMAPLTQSIIYSHYQNINTTPITTLGFPGLIQTPLTINYGTSCPSKILVTGSVGIAGPKDQLSQQITDLKALIDGGNTQNLLDFITNNAPGQVKAELLANSPYLSDEVLLAYLASNPSVGNVQQVMLANFPLSPNVMDAFIAKNYPGGVKKQVIAHQNGISQMTLLQNEINVLKSERQFYVDELIRYYINDSTVVNPMDSIINILNEEGDRISKEELCDALIIKGDLANATFVRAEIISEYGESNYTDLAEININTRTEVDPILIVNNDSTMRATVEFIANDNNDPRMCPRGEATLYEYAYSPAFVHEIEDLFLPGQGPKSMFSDENIINGKPTISIYPNPTNSILFVDFTDFENTETLKVDIYNLVGQKIISVSLQKNQPDCKIDVTNLPAGVYFVHVEDDKQTLSTVKVVVE